MPGLPLQVRQPANISCHFCLSQTATDQMCRHQSRSHLSTDEQLAAEESFSLYCKPVEFYNILQRRAIRNPYFLRRSLLYNIQAKREKRIRISISLSKGSNTDVPLTHLFPLYILLARPVKSVAADDHSPIYQLRGASVLTSFCDLRTNVQNEVDFVVPEMDKLKTDSRASSLNILLVTGGENKASEGNERSEEINQPYFTKNHSFPKIEGKCFWGRIPLDLLCSSLEECVTLSFGQRAELVSKVVMEPSLLEPVTLERNECLTFCSHRVESFGSYQLQVNLFVQETGSTEKSTYECYSAASSSPDIMRLRAGNVLFNYRYYNNTLQKTEVTEDFSCPFCLLKCSSYKGLRCHLTSSHDLFNYEFWVTEEYQAVNISVKTDTWRSEAVADGIDPRLQTFFYRSKVKRQRTLRDVDHRISHVHPHFMESNSPDEPQAEFDDDYGQKENAHSEMAAQSSMSNSFPKPLQENSLVPPTVLQFGKTRKLSVERAGPRSRTLLQKRQFFHSHRAQPMALEQVFSDRDSEDEVDDDIADFEDRRMLDDFVDVTNDEKQIMHLWNSFVRKQRVLADGHIPWACEAFSRLHGDDLARTPALLWCWRFFLIKLWNHSLLDSKTINDCNLILESYQKKNSGCRQ